MTDFRPAAPANVPIHDRLLVDLCRWGAGHPTRAEKLQHVRPVYEREKTRWRTIECKALGRELLTHLRIRYVNWKQDTAPLDAIVEKHGLD